MTTDYYNDSRYIDIGDLPTGFSCYDFDELYVRPFCVRELTLLYNGGSTNGSSHIIRAVNLTISCDVNILTEGDFKYVLAWLRMHSYPKAPSQVHWTCTKWNVVHKVTRAFHNDKDYSRREMFLRNLEYEQCNTKNVEIVYNSKMQINSLSDDDLVIPYDDIDFPRMGTHVDYCRHIEKYPESKYEATIARWIKAGDTFYEKMALLTTISMDTYNNIVECMKRYDHGIAESMALKCRVCKNKVKHTNVPDLQTFFADNSEQNILDMQYTLLSDLKMQPDENMPAKTLLYHYASLAKDKREEQERENLKKAIRGGVR